jgi:hypothetical protein
MPNISPSANPMTDRNRNSDGPEPASSPIVFYDVETPTPEPSPHIGAQFYLSNSSREVCVQGTVKLKVQSGFVDEEVKGPGVMYTEEQERKIREEVLRRAKEVMDACGRA